MTDLTPAELLARIERLETLTGHGPPTEPNPEPDTVIGISGRTIDPEKRTITIRWITNPLLEIRTQRVSRNGVDTNGTGPWTSNPLSPVIREWTFGNLKHDTEYVFIVDVETVGGTADSESITANLGPAPVPPTPTPGTRRIPLIRKSGLPFNLIYFAGGNPNLKRLEAFGQKLGRPLDGELTFLSRGNWAEMQNAAMIKAVKEVHDSGRIVVISTPHAPSADNMNARGARNEYATQQKQMAALYASHGLNTDRIVWRVDWEFNLPNPWASNKSGPADLKLSVRNFVANFAAGGLTNNRFDQCPNGDRSQTGHNISDVYAGPDYVDVIGVDQYDQYPATFNAATWAQKQAVDASITTVLAHARKHGIMASVDECGNTHGNGGTQFGKDNPTYWQYLFNTVEANAGSIGWVTLYDHTGAPANLRHDFNSNPKSFTEIKRLLALIEERTRR